MIPAEAVSDLVPFAHGADHEVAAEGRRTWAWLERGGAVAIPTATC
jgi:hypothetical protein